MKPDTKSIVNILLKAKEDYYLNGSSELTDIQFDKLEEELKKYDPSNAYFSKVGSSKAKGKISHNNPMLSLDKAKNPEGVSSWLSKINCEKENLVCMPKIDGLSGTVVYDKGNLLYIATRGDGKEGQDVTHLAKFLNVPSTISIKNRFEVRGELYLRKDTSIPNPEHKSLRNLTAGLVNPLRKDQNPKLMNELKFVAYASSSEKKYFSEKLQQLEDLDFEIVKYKILQKGDIDDIYKEYINHQREEMSYETDGLVFTINDTSLHKSIDSKYVVNHHHFFNFALKPPSDEKETSLINIEWSVSKSGAVIPVAILDPIDIGGAAVSRTTLNNFENVKKLNLHKGDVLLICRSGDVIPFLKEKVKNSHNTDSLIPHFCPSCGSVLEEEGVHLVCKNSDCFEKNIQIISSWVKSCDMENVSEETVRKLYDEKMIKGIKDLYSLKNHESKLLSIDGFGKSKVDNLVSEIEKSRSMTIVEFLARLSISLIGEKAIVKLGIKSLDDFWKFNDSTYVIGQNVIAYREDHEEEIKELVEVLNIQSIEEGNSMKAKVCMTGKGHLPRKELIDIINSKGYEFVDSVTKDTKILICEDTSGSSTKLVKARKAGIELISYEEFFK